MFLVFVIIIVFVHKLSYLIVAELQKMVSIIKLSIVSWDT